MSNDVVLAFDTCLDKMYVSLAINSEIVESEVIENHDEKYHSAFLISTIKDVLKKHELFPEDITLIATNIGPGSFTGIRACTTVARVMAQQLGCKVVGVSSLEILSKINGKNSAVALDARKNKAYLYLDNDVQGAVDLDEVKKLTDGINLVTDDKLETILGGISYQKTGAPLGDILLNLAIGKVGSCESDWRKLKPLYIQPPPMG